MDYLRQAMQEGQCILIYDGTRSGKNINFGSLCNFLPQNWRIVEIEYTE